MACLTSDEADISAVLSADISACLCSFTSFLQGWLKRRSTLSMRMWHISHWVTSKPCLCNSFGSRVVVDFTASKSEAYSFLQILMANAMWTSHVYYAHKNTHTYALMLTDTHAASHTNTHTHTLTHTFSNINQNIHLTCPTPHVTHLLRINYWNTRSESTI